MSNNFRMDDYNDVPSRLREFFDAHPEGCLQQVKYELVQVGQQTFLVYTAAAYRSPDDKTPGIGTAWEPVPGKTPYTRDSEMQNAETSAWGRAIVAVGAADTRKGIATAEDVRNRQSEPPQPAPRPQQPHDEIKQAKDRVWQIATRFKGDATERKAYIATALTERGYDANSLKDLNDLIAEWETQA